ncbi:MAG: EscU/YscU/HrcU family type III secretion system export apparatus switch protein [Symbiobacteriia bacterium]
MTKEGQGKPPVAAALRYEPGDDPAPRVLAAGRGDFAQRLVAAAEQAGVPVVRDPALAQSLAQVESGQTIPAELYPAVAQVLAFLCRLDERARERWQPGRSGV